MPPLVDARPLRDDASVTPARRARSVSLLGVVALCAFCVALLVVIIVSALTPPESPWGSAPINASQKGFMRTGDR
jgi:hypothetical protein